jgi:predicted enzyme related to lactoylglutathione lyase
MSSRITRREGRARVRTTASVSAPTVRDDRTERFRNARDQKSRSKIAIKNHHATPEATMSTSDATGKDATSDAKVATSDAKAATVDLKLEVVVIPVADVDRAKKFYAQLGWRLDADFRFDNGFRIVQFTPPGSGCSMQFGTKITTAAPGSAQGTYLVVSDVAAARAALVAAGVKVGEIFHLGPGGRVSGPDPEHRSYSSRATFSDPDGNTWLLQEVTTRLPGRVDTAATSFSSASDLASAMRRASAAHGEHEKRIGAAAPNWPDWYAAYMVAEQSGTALPK